MLYNRASRAADRAPISAIVLPVALALSVLLAPSTVHGQVWIAALAGGGIGGDHAFDTAVTAGGQVYATGGFVGDASFGTTVLTSAGSQDAFVIRYGSDGSVDWAVRAGGTGEDRGRGVAVDADGNAYVVGGFFGTATFGATTLTSAGSRDIYVAKYSPTGEVLWARRAGGAEDDFGLHVALDAAGSAYVTGRFQLTADFGSSSVVSAGGNDVFVARYSPSGDVSWVRRGGSATPAFFELGLHIVADALGNVHVTGRFEQTADFGPFSLSTEGQGDILVVTYAADGTVLRALRAGGPGDDWGHGIQAAPDGGLYVTGWFTGTFDFGADQLVSAGGLDAYVARYSAAGQPEWGRSGGGAGEDRGYGVSVMSDGTVYTTGLFTGTATFGGGSLTSAGGTDVFLVRYTPSGEVAWRDRAGGTAADIAYLMDAAGDHVALAGQFEGTASFGGHSVTSSGGPDVFVTRVANTPVAAEEGPEHAWVDVGVSPNPLGTVGSAWFESATPGPVRIVMLDLLGREVVTIVDAQYGSGRHRVELDAGTLPAGVYVVRLDTDQGSIARTIAIDR